MSDQNSFSVVRFRIDSPSGSAADTSPRRAYEFMRTKTPNGKMSPAVRIGRENSSYATSLSIGAVIDRSPSAINATATATVAEFITGLITSTSGAAVALTLPTAEAIANEIGAVRGTSFEFMVDNSQGASTITVTVNTGITATAVVITGGATLTVLATAVGIFKLVFISATAAILYRVG